MRIVPLIVAILFFSTAAFAGDIREFDIKTIERLNNALTPKKKARLRSTLFEVLEKISKALGVLTHQTQAENQAGFFSRNGLIEDLLLPVFRLVFAAPQLRNVNQLRINFPYKLTSLTTKPDSLSK